MKTKILFTLLFFPLLAFTEEIAQSNTPSDSVGILTTDSSINETSKKWDSGYFGYFSSVLSDNKSNQASLYAYNLLSLNYHLDKRFRISIRPAFIHETSGMRFGQVMPANTRMSDTHLALLDRTPLNLGSEFTSKAAYKIYFPVTASSLQAETAGAFGAEIEISRIFSSGMVLTYKPKALVFLQKNSTYQYEENGQIKTKSTQSAQLEQWLHVSKYLNDKISVSQGLGLKNYYYNDSTPTQARQIENPLLETIFGYEVNNNIDFAFGIAQEVSSKNGSLQIYREDESTYVIMTSIRL